MLYGEHQPRNAGILLSSLDAGAVSRFIRARFTHAMKRISHLLSALVVLSLGACASYDRSLNNRDTLYLGAGGTVISKPSGPAVDTVSYWDGDNVQGAPAIVIRLSEQGRLLLQGRKTGRRFRHLHGTRGL